MNTKKRTLEISSIFLTLIFTAFIFPYPTHADGASLKISPSLIRIEAKPPADVWTPFVIENHSDQPVSLKIGYKPLDPQASRNGNVVFLTNGQAIPGQDKKIFEKMQVVDNANISHDTIDLGPQQKERLRLRILLPVNEPTSDYYFSLILLQTVPKTDQNNSNVNIENQKSFVTLQSGIGTNVLLAIGDKEAPLGSIETFAAPWFSDSGPIPFTLSVHNAGTHFIMPKGIILIKNLFGQTVGKVTIPPSVILAGTSRTIIGKNSPTDASTALLMQAAGDNPKQSLIWPEHFLLGMYTATITLTLSDKGPVYVRTIHFLAFPLLLIAEILLVIALIGFIYLRVKRKIS